jgi:cytidine deaminase
MEDDELIAQARAVARHAHSPYSGVRVGAALRGVDGRVFAGCNVENASYGLTICAERAAVLRAVADGCTRFERIAIWSSLAHALPPCGACRQVLAEFGLDLGVVIAGAGGAGGADGGGERVVTTLGELLPSAMGPGDLGRG